jgi:hypothetical protein
MLLQRLRDGSFTIWQRRPNLPGLQEVNKSYKVLPTLDSTLSRVLPGDARRFGSNSYLWNPSVDDESHAAIGRFQYHQTNWELCRALTMYQPKAVPIEQEGQLSLNLNEEASAVWAPLKIPH